jgi:hypothetical protein
MVGVNAETLWIEFKNWGQTLSSHRKNSRRASTRRGSLSTWFTPTSKRSS